MSIHDLSAAFASAGVKHIVVTAKSSAKFKNIESFAKSIKSEDAREYATSYHAWVKGGRKGNPPAAKDANFKLLKYIRAVVSQLV